MKALKTNKLASHPAYAKILSQYNELLIRDIRVNSKKFYENIILPEIPTYKLSSWYKFLRRFKTSAGLIVAEIIDGGPNTIKKYAESELQNNLVDNELATRMGIQRALNVGAETLRQLVEDPNILLTIPIKNRIDLLFKAMKAQDSRINAIAKIKGDTREEAKVQRAFDEAAYGDRE